MKGYIFTCTNKTEKECFDLMIFGTNKLYGDNVLEIERGDILYGLDFNKIKYSKPQIIDEKPILEATTLWDYPKQSYGKNPKGNNKYAGVTPAFIIYNMIKRYTEPGDLVVDPMAGSGTTLDVCREEKRRCIA